MKNLRWALLVLLGLYTMTSSAGWIDDFSVTQYFDDNLTRAQLPQDIKSDNVSVISADGGTWYQMTDNSRLSVSLSLSGSFYQHYQDLDDLNAGAGLIYRWKTGLGPFTPEFHASASMTRLQYQDIARNGWVYSGEIGVAERMSDRLNLHMSFQMEQRTSDNVGDRVVPQIASNVFDLSSTNLALGGDYSINSDYVASFAYTVRNGDIVSTTHRNLSAFLASSAIAPDLPFGPDMYAYKMKAMTRGIHLGISRIINDQTSLTLGYEHEFSRAEAGITYQLNLIRLTYLYEF